MGELLQRRNELVLPLTPDELERAIVGPARRVGLSLESGLASMMIRAVGDQPGALPLLQYALTELFEKRDGGADGRPPTLTKAAYAEIGGVLGALGRRAEDVFGQLDEAGQAAARQLFLRLVTLGEGADDTRRRVLRSEIESLDTNSQSPNSKFPITQLLNHPITNVIEAFGRSRLLSFDRDPVTRGPTVEVAHEALLREWPRLREWLRESRSDVRLQRQLAHAAAEWQNSKQEASFLLTGARLNQFETWASETTLALTQDERAFLHACFVARRKHEAEKEARLKQDARRRRTILIELVACVVILALGIVAALYFAGQATQSAQRAEANFVRAEAQRLAAEALNALNANASAETVALLSLRALNWQYSPQGDAALLSAAQLDYPARLHTQPTPLFGLEVSPDGQTLLTMGEAGRALLVLDVQTGETRQRFEHPTDILRATFSPDGRWVLSDGDDNRQRVWDIETGQPRQVFLAAGRLSSGVFADDSATIYAGTVDGLVQSWSLATGQEQQRWQLVGRVMDMAPQPQWALTSNPETLDPQLWDLASRQLLHTLTSPSAKSDAQFCNGGAQVMVGYFNGTAAVWEAASGASLLQLKGHTGAVRNVECSSDGQWLLTGGDDRTARVWEAETGREIRRFREQAIVSYLALTDNRQHVLTLSGDGAGNTLRVWETLPTVSQPIFMGHQGVMSGVAFSPDGRWLAASDETTLRVWDTASQQLVQTFALDDVVNYGLSFSPDGRQLAAGQWHHGIVELWDVASGELARRLTAAEVDGINDLAFSPDGRYLFGGAGTWSPTARAAIWDVPTGAVVFTLPLAETGDFYGADYSPDGATIATAHTDGQVRVWDARTGALLKTLNAGQGSLLIGLRFSPDGQWLATAGNDRLIHLWDVQTGQEARQFAGHTDLISHLAFSPDSAYVATASYDHTVRLWAVASGAEVRRYVGHLSGVENVAFAPDGQWLASVGDDGTARLWEVDYRATMQSLCSRLLRDFTDDERTQYNLPNDGPTCPKP